MIDLSNVSVNLSDAQTFKLSNFIEICQIIGNKNLLFSRGIKIKTTSIDVVWINYFVKSAFSQDKYYYFAVKDFYLAKQIKLELGLSPELPTQVYFKDKKSFQFGFSNSYPNLIHTLDTICDLIANWDYSLEKVYQEEQITKSLDKSYC